MYVKRYTKWTVIVAWAFVLSACSVLSPQPDRGRYFVLRPMASRDVAPDRPLTSLVLGLGPVTVPDYADRIEMIEEVSDNELRFSLTNRWIEPLGRQVRSAMGANLAALLQPAELFAHPWFSSDGIQLQVEIAFRSIAVDSVGFWSGQADWIIRDGVSRDVRERGHFSLGSSSLSGTPGGEGGPSRIAANLEAELERLSVEIADVVRRVVGRARRSSGRGPT